MKYSEFKTEVEKLGFLVVLENGSPVYVDKEVDGETILSIGIHNNFHIDPSWSGFSGLSEQIKLKIFELGCELAKTPLAEREEEKRYYLKYNVPSLIVWGYSKNPRWLHVVRNSGYSFICEDRTDNENVKTIFNESEIAQMDITGFQKVEVVG